MSTDQGPDLALVASLAAEIASERAYRGMTQEDVWTRAGMSKSAYLKIENGQPGVTRSITQIANIARALGLTSGELIRRAEDGAPNFLEAAADAIPGSTAAEREDMRAAIRRTRPKRKRPGQGASGRKTG